jgi:hypothetical protein
MPALDITEVKYRLSKLNLELISEYKGIYYIAKFRCYCGKEFYTKPKNIFKGSTRSCGCFFKQCRIDRITKLEKSIFGKWKVIKLLPKNGKPRKYLCECKCGKFGSITIASLKSGNSTSCGCESNKGINNPNYNPNLTIEERMQRRLTPEAINWSKKIKERDKYTCQICKEVGGKLHSHHLDGYAWCKEKRFDLNNGICLCKKCHKKFHKTYGNKNNTKEQFLEYTGRIHE